MAGVIHFRDYKWAVWKPIAWGVLGYEVVAWIVLTIVQNKFWDAYEVGSEIQIARAKQMMLLAMVWWALFVILSGATVFGDNLDYSGLKLGSVAVIPVIS